MIRIEYADSVNDTWPELCRFIETVQPILSLEARKPWSLDLRGCTYLGPDAAALIAAMYLRGETLGQHPRIELPKRPAQLDAFCDFIGLKHLIHKTKLPTPSDPKNNTVEIHRHYQPTHIAHRRVAALIHRYFDLSEEVEESLGVAVNEVVGNVCYHAQSPIGALVAARYMVSSKEIRVSVVDMGLGISSTLGVKHPEARIPTKALEMVFQGRYSAGSTKGNRGLGISNLAGQVERCRGSLILVSSDAVATTWAGASTPRLQALQSGWPGTAVFFTLRVEDPDD